MGKNILTFILLLAFTTSSRSQTPQPMTLKQVLLNQLKTTHNAEDWFAPLNVAIEGITADQANWKPKNGDHSIAELANHIIFWNQENLSKFLGEPVPKFSGDNNETFSAATKESWPKTVKKADSVLIAWENAIEVADDAKLEKWYVIISHISTHNAYHTGQIVFIRKLQGSWNPAKGVK
jgi:uncharacterized damage-inducible protein DinB